MKKCCFKDHNVKEVARLSVLEKHSIERVRNDIKRHLCVKDHFSVVIKA